jgi:hypothetical protein
MAIIRPIQGIQQFHDSGGIYAVWYLSTDGLDLLRTVHLPRLHSKALHRLRPDPVRKHCDQVNRYFVQAALLVRKHLQEINQLTIFGPLHYFAPPRHDIGQ